MAVAIRLARDVSKGAPDLPRPVHFRKGQIVRIEGPIHGKTDIYGLSIRPGVWTARTNWPNLRRRKNDGNQKG